MEPSRPYSIYSQNRPLKVALVVSATARDFIFDEVFNFNMALWGGLYNALILSDGKNLDPQSWQFLETYDPDIVKFLIKPNPKLIEEIDRRLSPYSVTYSKNKKNSVSLHFSAKAPLSYTPTKEIIQHLSMTSLPVPEVVVFDLKALKNTTIRKFIERNFGLLNETGFLKNTFLENPHITIKVSNLSDLNQALLKLSEYKTYIFPKQFASTPNYLPDIEYAEENERFSVVIGDQQSDLSFFWNKNILRPSWLRAKLTHLWLPEGLATAVEIKAGLRSFLRRYAGLTGNQSHQALHFYSHSVENSILQAMANDLSNGARVPCYHTFLSNVVALNFKEQFFNTRHFEGMMWHKAYSTTERVILEQPKIIPRMRSDEHWATDIYIESPSATEDRRLLWQLPSRRGENLMTFNQPFRVNKYGFHTLILKRNTGNVAGNIVTIKPLEVFPVVSSLICGIYRPNETDDLRKNLVRKRTYERIDISDKGQDMNGLIKLIGGLSYANQIFDSYFLRKVFNKFSNFRKDGEIQQENQLLERLKNIIKKNDAAYLELEEGQEWLAAQIHKIAKTVANDHRDLVSKDFENIAKEVMSEFNKKSLVAKLDWGEEEINRRMLEHLENLMTLGIVFMGVKPACPRCGVKNWRALNSISYEVKCEGCSYLFNLGPEENWHYRLNQLFKDAFTRNGITPQILVLGDLLSHSRYSFYYTPNINLYQKYHDKKNASELDIVCVQDGKFIVGEVKEKCSLFKPSDFDDMAQTAINIRADVVLFSSLDGPTRKVLENIKRIKPILKANGIEVGWYHLREPDPWPL